MEKRLIELALERGEVGNAVGGNAHAALAARHGNPGRAAEHLRGQFARLHRLVGKGKMSVELRQCRDAGYAQLVADELVIAGGLDVTALAERYLHVDRKLAIARRLRAVGEVPDPAGHGTLIDELQELRRRPGRLADDREHRVRDPEMRNVRLDRSGLRAEYPAALGVDRQAGSFELHVTVDAGELGPPVRVVERDVACVEGDQELAAPRVGERELREVAGQRDLHVGRRALLQAKAKPVAYMAIERQWQVAVEMLGLASRQLRLEVEKAGALRPRTPAPVRGAGCVRRGEAQVVDVDPQALIAPAPPDTRRRGIED